MSDLTRERERLGQIHLPLREATPAAAVMVGRVASSGAALAVGKFFKVNPVSVMGAEKEGGGGTVVTDTTVSVPVYLNGPGVPAAGDLLVCRFVDYRWVAERKGASADATNPCRCTWPAVLTYNGSVAQAQAPVYFTNEALGPVNPYGYPSEPPYTLTYQARPAAIPRNLNLQVYTQYGGLQPPYYVTMPDKAWFSPPIPAKLFGATTSVYFYLYFRGCNATVMVIDAPYADGTTVSGAGNNTYTYSVSQVGSATARFEMRTNPFQPLMVYGSHGGDDVVPDATGGAGYPSAVRSGA